MTIARVATTSRRRPAGTGPRAAASIVLLTVVIIHATTPLDATVTEEQDPYGDQVDALETPYWEKNLLTRWIGDQKFLATRWWGQEFRRFEFALPLALSTILAASSDGEEAGLDQRLGRSWRRSLGGRGNRFAVGLSRLGDAGSGIVLVGATYLLSRWKGNERLARSSSLSAEALLDAGLWNVALKRLARRTRPEGQSTGSFPSGHAMGAFAVATVLAEEYRDTRWVPWVAYTTAGLIGGSRVSLERHFPSDVMVGALLGHSVGRMVTARQRGDGGERENRFEPVFMPRGEGYGIVYVRTW